MGCKSHKNNVVNASPDFNAEETWQLAELRGKEVAFLEGQKKITIQINTEAGTFSGNSGCNRYFGNFKDLGNGKMILSDFNGTKMACPEAFHKMENSYMQLLHRCDGYRLGEYSLELLQGETVLLNFEKVKE
jgi:heat shock protein HslJ